MQTASNTENLTRPRHALMAGALFGIAVFLFMRLVVLPLSAFPHPISFEPLGTVLDLLSHMLLFGIPIAIAAKKAAHNLQPTSQGRRTR